MGELEKEKGAWGYVEGGMGGVSRAIASSARSLGVDIFTEKVISVSFFFFFCSLFCSLIKKKYSTCFPGRMWNRSLLVPMVLPGEWC